MPPPGRGRRPPWWPENETWPPRRRPPWAGRGGRRFLRFFLLAVLLAVTLGGVLAALGWWLTMSFLNRLPAAGPARPGAALALLLIVALLAGTLRRARWERRRRERAAEAQRRGFLADVTHELKTPLAVIRGQAEGIADGIYPASAGSVAPILEATRALEMLIEDLRTLSLTEAGALTLAREPVD
ncbi:MAG: histidine kinase dimerization/phospho-acceptor domain-containing protein, partial [Chloroflexota bacterium]